MTTAPALTDPNPDTGSSSTQRAGLPKTAKVVIGLLLASTFVVVLNETVMGVALPRLMAEFSISAATGQWLTTAFLLTLGIVIPTTGLILKRFTTRAVFITAMLLFIAGTATAAAAPVFSVLLVARILQAAGTALMLPLLMSTVLNFVPAERRGRMMGLISVVTAVAPAIGPTVSGIVLETLNWRWLFIIMLPIVATALTLGIVLMRNIGDTEGVRFDVLSIATSALGFGGLIFGLSSIGEARDGGAPIHPAISIGVGILSIAVFVLRQLKLQKHNRSLMDLRPLAKRSFTVPLLLVMTGMSTLFGTLILLPLYLQNIVGFGTLQTGLILLPGAALMGCVAPFIGRAFDRFGARPLVVPGTVIVSGALWAMTSLDENSPAIAIVATHVALSLGLGAMITPLLTTALGSVPPSLYSHGSAIVNTLQQIAGAAGTALFITLMSTTMANELAIGTARVAAEHQGIHTAFVVGASISLVCVVLAWFVPRGTPARPNNETFVH